MRLVLLAMIALGSNAYAASKPCDAEQARLDDVKAHEIAPPASYELSPEPTQATLPDKARPSVDALTAFIETAHCEEPLVRARFERARYAYRWHDYEGARVALIEVLDRHPTAELSQFAFNLLVDTMVRLHRYDEIEPVMKHYCADDTPTKRNRDIARMCALRRERHIFH